MKKEIRNLASIFVEGATDRIMYKTFFVNVLGYEEIKDKELEALQQEMRFGGELIPLKDSIVLFSSSKQSLVIIKSKNGKDKLLKFARENVSAIKPLKRKVKENLQVENFYIEIQQLFIAYVFDTDINLKKLEELTELYVNNQEVLIATQPTPEDIVLKIFDNYFLNEKPEWKTWLQECSKKLERLFSKHIDKRKTCLIKAMIGERCYYHLFETLFNKQGIKETLTNEQITWVNNLSGLI
ncbi:MAG: hypothetical protein Q9M37_06980 [Desulfonauticus sp.]|nr:hypothetical protein [Desulfonauticus sp.]